METTMQEVKIEKFTRKKYEKYVKKGIKVRIFNKSKIEYTVKQFDYGTDNKQVLMGREYYNKYQKKWCKDTWLYDEKGRSFSDQLYIVHGMEGIEKGDIIITKNIEESGFFFYELFTGFTMLEKNVGFGTHWKCDCYGCQINLSHTFSACSGCLKNEHYFIRKATDEEVKAFFQHLLDAGFGYDSEEGCLYYVPMVGVEYWSVEMEDGVMKVVHHEGVKSEEERPFGKFNNYSYKKKAEDRCSMINQVMLLGKLR